MPTVKATTKNINKAAAIIKAGGIVAFPTETVYGLGGNAFDAKAVKKIFKAKGRPSDNPLIVHIADKRDVALVAELDSPLTPLRSAQDIMMRRFWPGPLTLILKRGKNVPSVVSAGLSTVAVRMPDHAVARAFIRAAGVPIAAPSANKSGRPSPTDAGHVARDFGKKLFILDGGKTKIGLESTVVDCTVSPPARNASPARHADASQAGGQREAGGPVILRRGGVTLEELRRVVKNVRTFNEQRVARAKSPGMKYRHYAPHAPLVIVAGTGAALARAVGEACTNSRARRIGILATDEHLPLYMRLHDQRTITLSVGSRKDLNACARRLFAVLRKFDTLNVHLIITESFPERGIGAAIMDRLRRAAG